MVEDINGLHQKGRFPLVGNHLTADCQSCHTRYVDLYFEPLNTDCYACHSNNYNSTQNPSHISAGYSTNCQDCHDLTSSSWFTINVIHDFFPLVGGHAISDCFACHEQGGNFTGLSPVCISCHQNDYNATTDPNHVQNNYPTDCNICHTIYGWSPANIDHNLTSFPLTGKHTTVDCQECHSAGYTGTPTDCYSCHQTDYESAEDPNHVLGGYSTNCTDCHTTNGWDDLSNFNHNLTQFPLTGAHITEDCINCHQQGYNNTPIQCFGCHEDDYNNPANDPNHITANFPTGCEVCHNTTAWQPATFDHNLTTFPLTGKHITVNCQDCHVTGYTGTPTDCYSCHQVAYENVQDPNHVLGGYSTNCTDCHTTNGWDDLSNFNHDITQFPLTGAHITTDCINCHQQGYNNTPMECFACHADDFNNATNPNHQASGFPTTCGDCHSTSSWTPANFDHNFYPISSQHINVNCNECHSEPSYQPQCLSCHLEDFNNGHNPGDPTDCWACHRTSNWDSNFNHNNTNFPLTGAHIGLSCQDCHSRRLPGNSN